MTTKWQRAVAVLALGLIAALAAASASAAAGGSTIAGAPTARSGVQETGDTLSDKTGNGSIGSDLSPGCWNDVEYWRLPLKAGDRILVEGKAVAPAYHFQVGLFPAGTTDKNIDSKVATVSPFPTRGQIRFDAHTTGTYAIVFGPGCYDGNDGPFNFTVIVSSKG